MTDSENSFRPPETSIVGPTVVEPRPIVAFAAGALCLGAGALYLLMDIVCIDLINKILREDDWQVRIWDRFTLPYCVLAVLSSWCFIGFVGAGRCFFLGKKRRGGRFLLAAMAGVVFAVITDYYGKSIIFVGH